MMTNTKSVEYVKGTLHSHGVVSQTQKEIVTVYLVELKWKEQREYEG